MSPIVVALFCFMFASGFYLEYSESWNALYRAIVILHPAVAVVGGLFLTAYFIGHATGMGLPPPGSGTGRGRRAALFTLALAAATALTAFFPTLFMAGASASVAGFCMAARAALARKLNPQFKATAIGWQSVFFMFLLCLLSGAALLPADGLPRNRVFFPYHMRISVISAIGFGVALFLPILLRRLEGKAPYARYLEAIRPKLAVVFVAALVLFGVFFVESRVKRPTMTTSLSNIPIERRPESDRFNQFFDKDTARLLMVTKSCGETEGCHKYQVEDFYMSNHWLSNRTPHFQRNVQDLVAETNEENRLVCAGCHYPYMLFSGDLDPEQELNRQGSSCVMCHQATSIRKDDNDPRANYMTIEANVNHLKMFDPPAGGSKISKWNELLIDMNPAAHGRVFNGPLMLNDDSCLVCHSLHIEKPASTGFQNGSCMRCHMLPRNNLGMEGYDFSHLFPGANATMDNVLGKTDLVKLTKEWVRGDMDSALAPTGRNGAARLGLRMTVEPRTPAAPGRTFEFDVVTANIGMEHSFPSAPMDLLEAWLQIEARDAAGRVVFEFGKLGDDLRLPPDYPHENRLGGYGLSYSGERIENYRVWDNLHDVVEREIAPGESTRDRIRFQVPADAAGPLTLTAQWNYRKVNQDFLDFGLKGADLPPERRTSPVTVVGETTVKIDLHGS